MIFTIVGFVLAVVAIGGWLLIMWNPPSRLGAGRLHHTSLSGVPRSRGAGPVADPEAEAYALLKEAERKVEHHRSK